ncbi:MAG TPA: enoyl-CoA hydratase-related protein [Candidatus Sulfotelmatobacter sp.]|nr:enoyl-CoA hydratase-related protein [Candidatus Sulfotelmatobacter sp.]
MAGTMSEAVEHTVTIDDGVATVTFARPQAYNALTGALVRSLHGTLRGLDRDPAVRALVLTGAGKAFCAGQALDDPALAGPDGTMDVATAVRERYNPLILGLLGIEKPVVAAVNGVAAGAGFGIALACDFRIVAETASFTTAFVKIGLVPDSSVSYLLPRMIGYGKAVELCLLSEKIDAAQADALGLCTKVVPAERCVAEAHALAVALARGPRGLGLAKRELVRNGLGEVAAALAYEAEMQAVAGASQDAVEGVAAFREKRAPVYTGR